MQSSRYASTVARPHVISQRPALALRTVVPDDERLLLGLYTQTRALELTAVPWSEEEKGAFVRQQFEAQRTHYRARFPDSEHFVLLEVGDPVGRIWIDRRRDEIRLLDITIDASHRGRGIGGAVLRWLIGEATTTGVALRHSVLVTNEGALRFYRRLGFEVVEEFELYLLMEWRPKFSPRC